MTLHDRIIRFVTQGLHRREVTSTSKKYRKFVAKTPYFWFVGKAGAVRSGVNSSSSISITDAVKPKMAQWEKENGF